MHVHSLNRYMCGQHGAATRDPQTHCHSVRSKRLTPPLSPPPRRCPARSTVRLSRTFLRPHCTHAHATRHASRSAGRLHRANAPAPTAATTPQGLPERLAAQAAQQPDPKSPSRRYAAIGYAAARGHSNNARRSSAPRAIVARTALNALKKSSKKDVLRGGASGTPASLDAVHAQQHTMSHGRKHTQRTKDTHTHHHHHNGTPRCGAGPNARVAS